MVVGIVADSLVEGDSILVEVVDLLCRILHMLGVVVEVGSILAVVVEDSVRLYPSAMSN